MQTKNSYWNFKKKSSFLVNFLPCPTFLRNNVRNLCIIKLLLLWNLDDFSTKMSTECQGGEEFLTHFSIFHFYPLMLNFFSIDKIPSFWWRKSFHEKIFQWKYGKTFYFLSHKFSHDFNSFLFFPFVRSYLHLQAFFSGALYWMYIQFWQL